MKNNYSHYRPLDDGIPIFKYLSLDRLSQMLSEKTLRFNRADQLIEYHKNLITPAERKFLQSNYLQEEDHESRKEFNRIIAGYKRLCRQSYLNCWTFANSRELCSRYFPDGDGVIVKSSLGRLKKSLERDGNIWNIDWMEVAYLDVEEPILGMPEGISIFGRKNIDCAYEQEVRGVILTESKKTNPEFLSLRMAPEELIEEIIISPDAGFDFQWKMANMLEYDFINEKVKDGKLLSVSSVRSSSSSPVAKTYRSPAYGGIPMA